MDLMRCFTSQWSLQFPNLGQSVFRPGILFRPFGDIQPYPDILSPREEWGAIFAEN